MNLQSERSVRVYERNKAADTKTSEGGAESAPGAKAEIPLQPMEDITLEQVNA